MKKLLIGAMMSALFVMNAEAGIFSALKNKVVQVQHKIKKDRTMDETKEIKPFKTYLKNITKTADEFYNILENEEKSTFKPAQDSIGKFVIFARTSYKKNATYDEYAVAEYISGIKEDLVWSVLAEHNSTQQYKSFTAAVYNAYNFAVSLQQKYPSNMVLNGVVKGLSEIWDFVSGKAAERKAAEEAEAARLQA